MVDAIADMDHDPLVKPEDILSEQELESLRLAQDLYMIRAKQAAANLAEVLELPAEAREQVIGSVAMRLANLDFEERREIAIKFSEVSIILGGVKAVAEQGADLTVVPPPEDGPGETDNTDNHPPGEGAAARGEGDDNPEEAGESVNLGKSQIAWLARIYGEEKAQELGVMPKARFDEFLSNLTEHYQALKVTRITAAGRIQRAMQLKLLMGGKDYRKVAREFDLPYHNVWSGLVTMADGIAMRTSTEDLLALIPNAAEAEEPGQPEDDTNNPPGEGDDNPEEAGESVNLGKSQVAWLARIYGDEIAQKLGVMPKEEFERFLTRLSVHYLSLKIRRITAADKHLRVRQLEMFMNGKDYHEVAEEFNAHAGTLRGSLVKMTAGITRLTSTDELLALLPQSPEADGGDLDIDADLLPLQETALPLSNEQQRWILKLMADPSLVATIEAMTPSQREKWSLRLSQHLDPAIRRRFGPDTTRIRVGVMAEFIAGIDTAAIASGLNITTEAVKGYLQHAAERLKDTVPHEKLVALVAEAQSFTPAEVTEE